jgi:hypothetical protein
VLGYDSEPPARPPTPPPGRGTLRVPRGGWTIVEEAAANVEAPDDELFPPPPSTSLCLRAAAIAATSGGSLTAGRAGKDPAAAPGSEKPDDGRFDRQTKPVAPGGGRGRTTPKGAVDVEAETLPALRSPRVGTAAAAVVVVADASPRLGARAHEQNSIRPSISLRFMLEMASSVASAEVYSTKAWPCWGCWIRTETISPKA